MKDNGLPQDVREKYEKATIAIERKNYLYAIELLIHVINIKPDFAQGRRLLRLAQIKNFEQNPPGFLTQTILRILCSLYMFVARQAKNRGDSHNALSIYEDILRNDPKNVSALLELGKLLSEENMIESAVVTLESAINISPNNAKAYEMLAETYSKHGEYERARYCLKKLHKLRPHDAEIASKLKNLDATMTIQKSFKKDDDKGFGVKEILE